MVFENLTVTIKASLLSRGGATMFAIIETGGKQYKVSEGELIFVEKLDANEDETVTFDKVVAVSTEDKLKVGDPYVKGATVEGKVVAQGKDKKIIVFKYKPKKGYRRKIGHRQPHTKIQISKISVKATRKKAEPAAEAAVEAAE